MVQGRLHTLRSVLLWRLVPTDRKLVKETHLLVVTDLGRSWSCDKLPGLMLDNETKKGGVDSYDKTSSKKMYSVSALLDFCRKASTEGNAFIFSSYCREKRCSPLSWLAAVK